MGAHWDSWNDAGGPVLVRVTAEGFRMLQSLPLGGAIPFVVSPEEAGSLKEKGKRLF